MTVAEKMLRAIANPFHWPPQPFRCDSGERVFAIGKQLRTEATTDIGCHHTHLVRRKLHDFPGDDVTDDMAALTAKRERVALAIALRDHPTCVEIVGHQPLIDNR